MLLPQIIREGYPCHLYFDIEYQQQCNLNTDGDRLIAELLWLVDACLFRRFACRLDLDNIVEMDSTTDTKFSRHFVLPLPGRAFANNLHVGAFVSYVLQTAKEQGM